VPQDRILARDHGEYVRAERDVLTSVRHPFIVQLHWSFQVRPRRGAVSE
jgi:ribosomal protein S6 kinase beta